MSGTFGELRSGHFHGGIDIKSRNGRPGQPIYAIADGFVSQIFKQPWGYGNGVYITHKDSTTSVYGHLTSFSNQLDSFVSAYQHQYRRAHFVWEADSALFYVRKGDVIGYMGNSGHSYGPHLHFELRRNGQFINPLHHFPIVDTKAPTIRGVYLYPVYEQSQTVLPPRLLQDDNRYIDCSFPAVAIGMDVIDYFNGYNQNGVFAILIKHNGDTIYQMSLDSMHSQEFLSFYDHVDSKLSLLENKKIHQCFEQPGSDTGIGLGDGIVNLEDDIQHIVELEVQDFNGNRTTREIHIQRTSATSMSSTVPTYSWHWDFLTSANATLFLPIGSNKSGEAIHLKETDSTLTILPYGTRFAKSVHISWYCPGKKQSDAFLASVSGEKIAFVETIWQGDTMHWPIYGSGHFKWTTDTIPPVIKVAGKSASSVLLLIEDNVAYPTYDIECFVDETQWIPHEYNVLRNTITIPLKNVSSDKLKLEVRVEDSVNNQTTFSLPLN